MSFTFTKTRYLCNLDVWVLIQGRGDDNRLLVTPEVLSKYNDDSICFFILKDILISTGYLLPIPFPN